MRRATTALCAALFCLLVPTGGATAATCPNEALRVAQGATSLPGCMALEMVSPPKKFSQPALLPSFSKDGERVLTLIRMALADTPGYQTYEGDFYVGMRGADGWELNPTGPLDPLITAGGQRWGGAIFFTPELDRWAMAGSTQTQFMVGATRMFTGGLDGSFDPLSPLLVPIDDSISDEAPVMVLNMLLPGASADLTAVIVRATFATTGYLPGDPRSDSAGNQPGGDTNSYVTFLDKLGEPAVQLLARDKEDEVWGGRCGTHLGGPGSTFTAVIRSTFTQGAISPDGSRIFFSTRPNQAWEEEDLEGPPCNLANGLRVLKRTSNAADEPTIAEIAPGTGPAEPGDDLFQAASADGTRVYLLSPRKLTGADNDAGSGPCSGTLTQSKGCDLYLYEEGNPLVLVSDGPEEASVLNSTTAISGDGSHAYFVAQGVLTADTNPEGDPAVAGQPNLYVYDADADALAFIATLSPGDATGMWNETKAQGLGEAFAVPVHGGAGPEDGGDGHILAFASKANIDDEDADGGFRDVFRYDADADAIERISKAAPDGSEEPGGDASVNPAWRKEQGFNFNEATRWVSEDGQTIAFATKEALIPSDEDGLINPYVSEDGTLGAVFAPLFDENSETRPPAVAPTGGQIAFSTTARLLPVDTDVAEDVYVARADGGFKEAVQPTVCDPLQEGSCQETMPTPQAPPAPASSAFSGPGNAKEPPRCRKGQVKRRGRCVKRARKGKVGKRADRRHGGRS